MRKRTILFILCSMILGGCLSCNNNPESSSTTSTSTSIVEQKINIISELNRNSEYVKYHGRNVHLGHKVIMNNIGSGFEVTFSGTKLLATMDGWYGSWYGKTKIAVLVDGETDTTKKVVTISEALTTTEYTLVEGLTQGIHTVKVLKITEALASDLNLYEIKTDGYFEKVDKTPRLKLEAYGDSITAGYGNLRGDAPDATNSDIQDGMQTYATYTATSLNADINVQARSGIGMYTAANVDDRMQVNSLYGHVNYDGKYLWNLHNYIPDIVIINLGTNDYWNGKVFKSEDFIREYVNTVSILAEAYGEETIFLLVSGLMEQAVDTYVKQVGFRLGSVIPNLVYTYQFKQCNAGHPVIEEHKEASDELVNFILDNGLDYINIPKNENNTSSPSSNEMVDVNIKVEIQDEIPSYCDLYLKGLGDENIKLTKSSNFVYEGTAKIKEGDYQVKASVNLNGEINHYEEIGDYHNIYVRKDNPNISFIADTMFIPEDPNPNADTFGWSMSTVLFEGGFEAISETSVKVTSNNWMAGFVTRQTDIGDNYKVSAHIKVDKFTNVTNEFFGLAPYYVDDLNFIWTYIQFSANGVLKSIGCTGMVNGSDIGFIDFWNFANIEVDFLVGETLEVERQGTSLTINFKGISETKTISTMTKLTKRFGVQCSTPHTVTFTDLVQVSL